MTNWIGGSVSRFNGSGDGKLSGRMDHATGNNPHTLAVGDLNLDGQLDLVVASNASSTISVLIGNVNGTFLPAVNLNVAAGGPRGVAVGDLDGDGKPDIVAAGSSSSETIVLLNTSP
ncbi:MAG: VCBS repeat-containing protein [Myxococcales bacterium]|nr:VCBS repeat-containing protein [Myxococcales bacterium]